MPSHSLVAVNIRFDVSAFGSGLCSLVYRSIQSLVTCLTDVGVLGLFVEHF